MSDITWVTGPRKGQKSPLPERVKVPVPVRRQEQERRERSPSPDWRRGNVPRRWRVR